MYQKGLSIGNIFANLLESVLILILIFIGLNIFLGQLLVITGDSMAPTLEDREQIIGEKASINFKDIDRGEIIIFDHPEEEGLIIKRVIALPGETIKIEGGSVHIDGTPLHEPYLKIDRTSGGPKLKESVEHIVPNNSYVVMGDNRDNSLDSRYWGFLPMENIRARALLVYYPIENFRRVNK